MPDRPPAAVVFDVGRVLLHWDPRLLYRRLLPDDAAVEDFLTRICPPEWNLEQDRGRDWDSAVRERSALFPDHADLIAAWHHRWHETVPGAIDGTVEILRRLQAAGVRTLALTNFSAEKWEECLDRFPFLASFDDAVVSGRHGVVKPDPAIYRLVLDRSGLDAGECFFTDDSAANIAAARQLGFRTHLFDGPEGLSRALRQAGLAF